MRLNLFSSIIFVLSCLTLVQAHVGRGVPGYVPLKPERRHALLAKRLAQQNRLPLSLYEPISLERRKWKARPLKTDEIAMAKVMEPEKACEKYRHPVLEKLIPLYPKVRTIAQIVPTDREAWAIFNQFKDDIPQIPQKLDIGGEQVLVPYDDEADPDCWWSVKHCILSKNPIIPPDTYACPEARTFGLTYDDGPNCTHNALYDYLNEVNQKATMFFIGSNIMVWPLQAQRAIVDGHHICLHTWSHPHMVQLTDEQLFAELYYSVRIAQDVMGVTPTCWRPPYGDIDDRVRYVAYRLGLETMMWKNDTADWRSQPTGDLPPEEVKATYQSINNDAKTGKFDQEGTIVLSHEFSKASMDIAIEELRSVQEAFDHVMPISACQNITRPYLEDNIVYPDFISYKNGNLLPIGLPVGGYIKVTNYTDSAINPRISELPSFTQTRAIVTGLQPEFTSTVFPTQAFAASGNQTYDPATLKAEQEAHIKRRNKIIIIATVVGGTSVLFAFFTLLFCCCSRRGPSTYPAASECASSISTLPVGQFVEETKGFGEGENDDYFPPISAPIKPGQVPWMWKPPGK